MSVPWSYSLTAAKWTYDGSILSNRRLTKAELVVEGDGVKIVEVPLPELIPSGKTFDSRLCFVIVRHFNESKPLDLPVKLVSTYSSLEAKH